MASRTNRKGFSPKLPEDGWHQDRDGPWEDYKERCVREGAYLSQTSHYTIIEWNNVKGLHRVDGPAREWIHGKVWYVNNQRHRLDGPARILRDGLVVEFFKDGIQYTDTTFTQRVRS